jgi:predicted GIY-YIG superfamily endonuclease
VIQIPDLFKNSEKVYQYRLLLCNYSVERTRLISHYESMEIEEHLTKKDVDCRRISVLSRSDLKQKMNTELSGVYLLYNRFGILNYIGKSKDVRRRLMSHFNTKDFDDAYVFTMNESDMHWVEQYLITRLFPKENQEMKDKYPVSACCNWTPVNTLTLQ